MPKSAEDDLRGLSDFHLRLEFIAFEDDINVGRALGLEPSEYSLNQFEAIKRETKRRELHILYLPVYLRWLPASATDA